jgi:hypothetical protein
MNPRTLSKSRFKLAMECPTKLYYTGKKNEYANQNIEDSFLLALADGGFQVGELAKCYFDGGYEIETLDYEEALAQTNELLVKEDVIIYEAAVKYQNLFIRIDVLKKHKNVIEVIEVKAKSVDPQNVNFFGKKGALSSEWKSYLYDVAFQKYVTCQAFPGSEVFASLMLADKSSFCPTDGLNQKFRIRTIDGRKGVTISPPLTAEDKSVQILKQINVDVCCDEIWNNLYEFQGSELTFYDLVETFAKHYEEDKRIDPILKKECASCEFYAKEQELQVGLKSGRAECWKQSLGWEDSDFKESTILDIWNFRKKDEYLQNGIVKISQINSDDIDASPDGKPGLSPSERQWMQVEKYQVNDNSVWIDKLNLKAEMKKWTFPLHFIDFETSMVAIPFNKGRHPYEAIAFQFSHHIVDEEGNIKHTGEYLNVEPGTFPNYDFVRELKRQLDSDEGTIFRYAAHENSYLNFIRTQIIDDMENIPDGQELIDFIETITQSTGKVEGSWTGQRNMVDMLELVKRYFYDPAMGGSNSIKKVLPAILNASTYLQDKYTEPIYGAAGGIESLNYKDWRWIQWNGDKVADPYTLLPKLFSDMADKEFELISDSDEIKEGGAALTAYARMQFEDMSEYERSEICKGLLKYCELDTFAMVMIYEGWREMVGV